MPKALFFSVPGHGHVTPSLPVAAELTRRGHHILYFGTQGYRTNIEAAGAEFRAYSGIEDDYFTSRGLHGGVPQRVTKALMMTSEAILPELLDVTRDEQPDYILFDGLCPWGRLVAQITKLPSIGSLAVSPITKPPLSAMLKMLPSLLPLLTQDVGDGIDAIKRVNAITKRHELPRLGMIDIMNNSGDISLSYTSREFQLYADTVPPSVRFVGWTPYEPPRAEPFSFEKAGDRRIVYASLGTLNNNNVSFYKACIEAFTGRDEYLMITTGDRLAPESLGALPNNVAVHRWLPQVEILKRASLFISHGGLNSVHDSLYFGVPMLLVPQQLEQTWNSERVVELCGGLLLKPKAVSAQTIRDGARMLLNGAGYRDAAKRIGETFRAAGGAPKAADEVEKLIKQ
jgi:MGT family glycosyltransferase